jgi:hypothetical protein
MINEWVDFLVSFNLGICLINYSHPNCDSREKVNGEKSQEKTYLKILKKFKVVSDALINLLTI